VLRRIRGKFTYANVVATLALFIALGGSSYAALSIGGRDVRNNSLTYRDLKRDTLGGSRIKESRLGTVKRARNALKLDGLTAQRLLLKCPAGTLPTSDVCVEVAARPPAGYSTAEGICSRAETPRTPGRRLPSYAELRTALNYTEISLAPGGELTNHIYPNNEPNQLNVLVITSDGGSVGLTQDNDAFGKAFRCVADPLN